jgi:hypothetical protein
MTWSEIPPGTAELVHAIAFDEVTEMDHSVESKLVSEEIVGGLSPKLHGLQAGKPPTGAFIKHHSSAGYCPPQGRQSILVLSVFAMPAGHRLRKFESIGVATIKTLEDNALAWDVIVASYSGN